MPLQNINNTDEDPVQWSHEGLIHRVCALEAIAIRHDGHLRNIDSAYTAHSEDVKALGVMHKATLETLDKIQETLVLMNEVLITYDKAKSFFSVFGRFGELVIFLGKVCVGCAGIYAAIHYGKQI